MDLLSDKRFSVILVGSVWTLLARLLAMALGFVVSIIIARYYGAEFVGIIAVLNSFILLVSTFTSLGTNTSILRFIPEHLVEYSPASSLKVYRKCQFMVVFASLLAGGLSYYGSDLIAGIVFSKPQLSFYFSLAAVSLVFKSLTQFNIQATRGLQRIRMFAFLQLLPQGLNLLLLVSMGILYAATDIPVYALLGSYAFSGILAWAIVERSFKKRLNPKDSLYPTTVREILAISFPMLMTSTMSFVIGQTGVLLLGMLRSEAEVGYYAIAIKLATLTALILNSINSIAAPRFSELFHSGKIDELFYVAKKSTKLIFWTTTPILAVLVILGKPILSAAFGYDFEVAYPALVILVMGQFVNSVSGATGLFMNMTGNQKIFRNIMLVAAISNVGLNVLLIPSLGIRGAAFAAMISLISWNVTTLVYVKTKFGRTTGYFPMLAWL